MKTKKKHRNIRDKPKQHNTNNKHNNELLEKQTIQTNMKAYGIMRNNTEVYETILNNTKQYMEVCMNITDQYINILHYMQQL